jgi:hypothetical protein
VRFRQPGAQASHHDAPPASDGRTVSPGGTADSGRRAAVPRPGGLRRLRALSSEPLAGANGFGRSNDQHILNSASAAPAQGRPWQQAATIDRRGGRSSWSARRNSIQTSTPSERRTRNRRLPASPLARGVIEEAIASCARDPLRPRRRDGTAGSPRGGRDRPHAFASSRRSLERRESAQAARTRHYPVARSPPSPRGSPSSAAAGPLRNGLTNPTTAFAPQWCDRPNAFVRVTRERRESAQAAPTRHGAPSPGLHRPAGAHRPSIGSTAPHDQHVSKFPFLPRVLISPGGRRASCSSSSRRRRRPPRPPGNSSPAAPRSPGACARRSPRPAARAGTASLPCR